MIVFLYYTAFFISISEFCLWQQFLNIFKYWHLSLSVEYMFPPILWILATMDNSELYMVISIVLEADGKISILLRRSQQQIVNAVAAKHFGVITQGLIHSASLVNELQDSACCDMFTRHFANEIDIHCDSVAQLGGCRECSFTRQQAFFGGGATS